MAQARTGVNDYRALMEKMIRHLHDVLYRQLTAWMIYGQLTDQHREFFIVRCDDSVLPKQVGNDIIPSHSTVFQIMCSAHWLTLSSLLVGR